jgi:hypothetical protein
MLIKEFVDRRKNLSIHKNAMELYLYKNKYKIPDTSCNSLRSIKFFKILPKFEMNEFLKKENIFLRVLPTVPHDLIIYDGYYLGWSEKYAVIFKSEDINNYKDLYIKELFFNYFKTKDKKYLNRIIFHKRHEELIRKQAFRLLIKKSFKTNILNDLEAYKIKKNYFSKKNLDNLISNYSDIKNNRSYEWLQNENTPVFIEKYGFEKNNTKVCIVLYNDRRKKEKEFFLTIDSEIIFTAKYLDLFDEFERDIETSEEYISYLLSVRFFHGDYQIFQNLRSMFFNFEDKKQLLFSLKCLFSF